MPFSRAANSLTLAAIDMGSNSFHLLVCRWREGALQVRFNAVERVRMALLMEGDRLTPQARDAALDCLRRFHHMALAHGADVVVAVGTAALRRASNPDFLLRPAAGVLGAQVQVLSGEEEAALIYRAVAARELGGGDPSLVIDIGGGSTELILGQWGRVLSLASLELGCVSSLKRYFTGRPLNGEAFSGCVQAARGLVDPLRERFAGDAPPAVFACSGTAQAVSLVLGSRQFALADLYALRERLLSRFAAVDQVRLPNLDENRRLLFTPGLAILIALFEALHINDATAVNTALREGVADAFFAGQWDSGAAERSWGAARH